VWEALEIPPPLDLGAFGYQISQVAVRYDAQELPRIPAAALPQTLRKAAPRRQVEWVLGRHCAYRAGQGLGIEVPRDLASGADRAPIWPAGIVGSITHKEGLVVAAVARQADVLGLGIDSERMIESDTLADITRLIASSAEVVLAETYAAQLDRESFFSLLFSAKESLYKCLYPSVRKFFSYLEAELESVDFEAGRFHARLGVALGADFPAGMRLSGRFRLGGAQVHTALVRLANQKTEP